MADEAALAEHGRAFEAILGGCAAASRSPQPAEMIHLRFLGQLARLQAETAAKLGLAQTEPPLGPRFETERKKLKELCGL